MARSAVIIALLLAAGCHKNDNYCAGANPDNNCSESDAGHDGAPACTSTADCTPDVCDLGVTHTCVQCTMAESAACTGTTPACVDNTCKRCTAHSQCDSAACLPDGSCAVEADVAYVDPMGGDNNACSKATPCTKVAKALATSRPYVKFTGTTNEQVTLNSRNVTFLAEPGAKLTDTNNGVLLRVDGSSQVEIYDLEITGGSGTTSPGISMPAGNTASLKLARAKVTANTGGGISASGGMLVITRSTIAGNAGGGISLSGGQFDITNNFIVQNGGGVSTYGGMKIDNISGTGMRHVEFNTLAANQAPATVNTGISCGTVLVQLALANNIIYGNLVAAGGKQIGGSANCATTYSDIGPDTATGNGNLGDDPMFANAAQGDFHILTGSPAKNAADPAASLTSDFDGDLRPQGSARDIGADEVP